jgi:hypothetical protein
MRWASWSITKAGRGAVWLDRVPFVDGRPDVATTADRFFDLAAADGHQSSIAWATIRVLLGGGRVRIAEYALRFAADAWQLRSGRKGFDRMRTTKAPQQHDHRYDGRWLPDTADLSLFNADELLQLRDLEDGTDGLIASMLPKYSDPRAPLFASNDLHTLAARARAMDRIVMAVIDRAHPRRRLFDGPFAAPRTTGNTFIGCPFAALGLEPTNDLKAITTAWKRKAFEAHPDRGGSHEAMVALTTVRDAAVQLASVLA